ncbi:phytanoyl-CoA dioxygenase family protein [Streptomyces sp. NPDC057621]|uniref:phytanoyl-CoA dioxygenase family protein n=1 Tax=Streptomyces sp. NPDC057621 TaxID=3346186 RepID=UPI0036B18227
MLTEHQIEEYRSEGFLLLEDVFNAGDIAALRREVADLSATEHPGRIFEEDGTTVRGIHGCHTTGPLFSRLVRLPQLLSAAEQILESKLHVFQFKVNAKKALRGEVWQWHQDYSVWGPKDGMPEPRAVNVALLLDDATEHNGPLLVVPGSHRNGAIAPWRPEPGDGSQWEADLSSKLKFALDAEQMAKVTAESEIRSVTGRAGSLLFFHPCIAHGSGANMSPTDRTMAFVSYNSVDNELREVPHPRPEFVASRDYRPLELVDGGLIA